MTHSPGQAGQIDITPRMIQAGIDAYFHWEKHHIFDDLALRSEFAAKEFILRVFQAMFGARGRDGA